MTITAQWGDKTLEFPDGTAAEVIQGTVKKLAAAAAPPPPPTPAPAPSPAPVEAKSMLDISDPEVLAGNPATRFATGAAAPALGMAELASKGGAATPLLFLLKAAGESLDRKTMHELTQRGRASLGSEGIDVPEMAGGALGPGVAAAGMPVIQSLLKRMAVGAGIGTGVGITAPTTGEGDYGEQKLEQAAGGFAAGGLVPAAGAVLAKAGKTVYHGLVEPWANPAAIKGRAYLDAAGDKVKEIIDLLAKKKQIVPGSEPTAGQAAVPASRAEFSALQESARKAAPSPYVERGDAQNAARQAAVAEIAGDPAKMAAAQAERTATAAPLYEAGSKQVGPSALKGMPAGAEAERAKTAAGFYDQPFQILLNRPSMSAAVKRAEKLIEEETGKHVNLGGGGHKLTGAEAQKVKLAFDDMVSYGQKSGIETAELDALKKTRGDFIGWMEKQFPDLAAARAAYKEGSKPINQMEVGTTLQEKLTPALRDDAKQRAAVFAEAVRNSPATLKKATGEPRYTELDQVLTPRHLKAVNSVQADLARSDRHLELARAGAGSANAIDLATQNMEREVGGKIPNFMNRAVYLTNAVINRLEGKVNKKLASEMAVEMLNPAKVGESLAVAQARAERNKMIADAVRKMQPALSAGAAAVATRDQGD